MQTRESQYTAIRCGRQATWLALWPNMSWYEITLFSASSFIVIACAHCGRQRFTHFTHITLISSNKKKDEINSIEKFVIDASACRTTPNNRGFVHVLLLLWLVLVTWAQCLSSDMNFDVTLNAHEKTRTIIDQPTSRIFQSHCASIVLCLLFVVHCKHTVSVLHFWWTTYLAPLHFAWSLLIYRQYIRRNKQIYDDFIWKSINDY